jgi:hypothetical protein
MSTTPTEDEQMAKPKCMHGLPADYCDTCQHDAEIATLTAEIEELRRDVVWCITQDAYWSTTSNLIRFDTGPEEGDTITCDGTPASIRAAVRQARGKG